MRKKLTIKIVFARGESVELTPDTQNVPVWWDDAAQAALDAFFAVADAKKPEAPDAPR